MKTPSRVRVSLRLGTVALAALPPRGQEWKRGGNQEEQQQPGEPDLL